MVRPKTCVIDFWAISARLQFALSHPASTILLWYPPNEVNFSSTTLALTYKQSSTNKGLLTTAKQYFNYKGRNMVHERLSNAFMSLTLEEAVQGCIDRAGN